MEESKKRS